MREIQNWTEPEYRADPRVSASGIRLFATEGPASYKATIVDKIIERTDSAPMRLGRIFHLAMAYPETWLDHCFLFSGKLEDDELREGIAKAWEKRTKASLEVGAEINNKIEAHREYRDAKVAAAKAAGKEYFTQKDFDGLRWMIDSVYANDAAKEYVGQGGPIETPVTNIHVATGLGLKALVDLWCGDTIVDFKTTRLFTATDFCKDALKKGYHYQAAHYLGVTETTKFVFITVRSSPPYEAMVYSVPDSMLYGEGGAKLANDLWLADIWRCHSSGDWSSTWHGHEVELADQRIQKYAR